MTDYGADDLSSLEPVGAWGARRRMALVQLVQVVATERAVGQQEPFGGAGAA